MIEIEKRIARLEAILLERKRKKWRDERIRSLCFSYMNGEKPIITNEDNDDIGILAIHAIFSKKNKDLKIN